MGNNRIDIAKGGLSRIGGLWSACTSEFSGCLLKCKYQQPVGLEFWSGPGSWELAFLIGFINDYYMKVWELSSQVFENLQQAENS